jgi:hypothetical protein
MEAHSGDPGRAALIQTLLAERRARRAAAAAGGDIGQAVGTGTAVAALSAEERQQRVQRLLQQQHVSARSSGGGANRGEGALGTTAKRRLHGVVARQQRMRPPSSPERP